MPIKFRCNHCQQFLGISRSKAAAIVDCPRCGRSIRVPNLDGTVDPVPQMPVLDTHDPSLRDALTALTQTPADDSDPELSSPRPDRVGAAADMKAASVLPVPPPLSALGASATATLPPPAPIVKKHSSIASEPVPAVPQRQQSPSLREEELTPLTAIPVAECDADDAVVFEVISDQPPDAALAELVAVHAEPSTEAPAPGARTRNQRTSGALLLVMVLMIPIAAVGGFLGARWYEGTSEAETGRTGRNSEEEPQANVPQPNDTASSRPQAPAGPSVSGNLSRIYGSVTYLDDRNLSAPDTGALILLLPSDREGRLLISSDALRSDPVGVDFAAAAASIHAIGGRAAICGTDGSFDFQIPATGEIGVFAFSRHVSQPDDVEPAAEETVLLSKWVDSPVKLRGRVRVGFRMLAIEAGSAKQIEFQLDALR